MTGRTGEITARLLGQFTLTDGAGRSLLPRYRKSQGVLAYLLYRHDQPVPRNTLADLFWHDRGQKQGLASLRQSIAEIRAALGEVKDEMLEARRTEITLRGDLLTFDLWNGGRSLKLGAEGVLFDGLDPVNQVFDEWLFEERRDLERRLIQAMEAVIRARPRDDDAALGAAEGILRRDPCHEMAARAAMEILSARGQTSRAIRVYHDVAEALQAVGFQLEPETRALFASLKHQKTTVASAGVRAGAQAGDRPPSLALGRVQDASDPTAERIDDRRLTEALISRLAEIRELRLLTEAETLDQPAADPVRRARDQGAEYLLTGTADHSSDRLDANFTLMQLASGRVVTTVRVRETVELGRIVADELAGMVASTLAPAIEQDGFGGLDPDEQGSWGAYRHYLYAKSLIVRPQGMDYMTLAERHLERAVELEPDFTPPYPFLIGSYNSARKNTTPGLNREEGSVRALMLARQFLMRDARNPAAHLALAWCLIRMRQFDLAEQSLEHAVDLGPYEPTRLNSIGTAYVYLGELDRGQSFYDLARKRSINDLDYAPTDMGELCYFRRDFEKAAEYLTLGELRNPLRPLVLRAAALAQLGRLREAREAAARALDIFRDHWHGTAPYTPKAAIRWYVDDFAMKRQIDLDNVIEGLTKAGFEL